MGTGISVVGFTLLGLVPDLESFLIYNVNEIPLSPDSAWIQAAFAWPAIGMYVVLGAAGRVEGGRAVVAGALCGLVAGCIQFAMELWEPLGASFPPAAVHVVTYSVAAGGALAAGSARRLAGALMGGAAAGLIVGLLLSPGLLAALNQIYGEGVPIWLRTLGVAVTWLVFGGLAGATFWSLVPLGERLVDPLSLRVGELEAR